MQGKSPISQNPLSRLPKSEDLQKLLRAAQSGTPVQQPILLPGKAKVILKVQLPKAGPGLGRARGGDSMPLWSLHEGLTSLWEYSTVDLELILNLVEEGIYSSQTKSGTSIPIINMLGEPEVFPSGAADVNAMANSSNGTASSAANQVFRPLDDSNASAAGSSSSANNPVFNPTALLGQNELSGNLNEQGVVEVIQSINSKSMTGRLDISSGLQSIEIFFEKGTPLRASYQNDSMSGGIKDMTGEEVILEAMTWKRGFFQFNPSLQSAERSPMRRLEYLIKDGSALRDYMDRLEALGLHEDATPMRLSKPSETEFEKVLSLAVPVNIEEQKSLYIAFDGKKTVGEAVNESGLPKASWLPILYNLSKVGFIGLPGQAAPAPAEINPASSPMVKEAVKDAFAQLLRADTGMLSYPLFMHFVEVEYQRAMKLRMPISLIIIGVHKEEGDIREELSGDDFKLVAQKFRDGLEPFDHIGHYQTFDVGILLPHRPSAVAREHVAKIICAIDDELAQGGNPVRLVWSLGIGCIPEDGIKTEAILSKAERDKVTV